MDLVQLVLLQLHGLGLQRPGRKSQASELLDGGCLQRGLQLRIVVVVELVRLAFQADLVISGLGIFYWEWVAGI